MNVSLGALVVDFSPLVLLFGLLRTHFCGLLHLSGKMELTPFPVNVKAKALQGTSLLCVLVTVSSCPKEADFVISHKKLLCEP